MSDHLPLHPLEFRILLVLLESGPSHGYPIVKAIEARAAGRMRIYPANLYRRIRELLSRGWIREVPPPEGEAVDPRRSYVEVTAVGRQVARAEAARLQELLRDARSVDLVEPA